MKNDNSVHNRNADFIGGNHFRMRDAAEGSEQFIGMGNTDCCGLPACKQYEVKIRMTKEEAIEELKTRYLTMSQCLDKEELHKANKAIDMAIKALEQQAICPSAGIDCVDCPAGDDAISRQAVKDLGAECIAKRDENGNLIPLGSIDSLPFVSTEKIGRWIYDRRRDWDGECKYECSECGMGSDVNFPYCMRCGTKMEVEE